MVFENVTYARNKTATSLSGNIAEGGKETVETCCLTSVDTKIVESSRYLHESLTVTVATSHN